MKLAGFLSTLLIAGFLFIAILHLHPVGTPLGNKDVFKDRGTAVTDITNVNTMDDYYLRNGQRETGSNNIVTSVVFDYRAYDTLGEATVLFIVVSSISMLLFSLLKSAKVVEGPETRVWRYPQNVSRIIVFGSFLMYPLIIIFGVYMVIHGHLSPGGGFQGGAVMASGTALLLISALITKNLQKTNKIFSIFESLGLSIFIGLGFAGIGAAFLNNFLVNGSMDFFGKVIEFGPNPGYLNSGGILPLLSLAVGIEVFCGLSIILISLYYVSPYTGNDKKKEEQI